MILIFGQEPGGGVGNLEPRGLGVLGGGVQGSPTVLILILILFCLGGCRPVELLPDLMAPGCGVGQQVFSGAVRAAPAQASGGAAECLPRTVPVRAGGPLRGGHPAGVCPLCVPGSGVSGSEAETGCECDGRYCDELIEFHVLPSPHDLLVPSAPVHDRAP